MPRVILMNSDHESKKQSQKQIGPSDQPQGGNQLCQRLTLGPYGKFEHYLLQGWYMKKERKVKNKMKKRINKNDFKMAHG